MKIKGLPKGYEAVRWGVPIAGDWIAHDMIAFECLGNIEHACLIVAPCSEEHGIRPFANSEDFVESAKGLIIVLNITTGNLETVLYIDDHGIETIRGAISYEKLLFEYEFSDGRACGYEDQ